MVLHRKNLSEGIEEEGREIKIKDGYSKEDLDRIRGAINKNPLTLNEIKTLLKRIGNSIDIGSKIGLKDKNGKKMDLKITANDFSIVELFSLFSDQEVEGFLESNISKNNTVDLFKFYFQEAIQFLKDVPELASIGEYRTSKATALPYKDILDSIARDSSEIKSIGDLIAFVKNPYKEKIKTEIKSIIIKTMFCCRDYGDNQLESKKAQIEEILKIFTDTPKGKNNLLEEVELDEKTESFRGTGKGQQQGQGRIPFSGYYRNKGKISSVLKALADPKYGIIKNFGDEFGITFKTLEGDFEKLLEFIRIIKKFIEGHNNKNSKNKLAISEISVKGFEENNVVRRLRRLFSTTEIKTDQKPESGEMDEIKFKCKYGDINGIEIKFHLPDNDNEMGLSDHEIYKLHTRIGWLAIRLWSRKVITKPEYLEMAKRAVSNMDEGSKRKLITQLNNWIMKKETIEGLKNKNIQILTLAQDANLGEIVEVLLAHYTQNNILLPNGITNNQGLITSLIELPSPIPTVQAGVQRKVRELTPQT